MLTNNTYEIVHGYLAANVALFSAVLIRRMKAQGAITKRTELEQSLALSGIVNEAEVFSCHEVVLSDVTSMVLHNAISFKGVRR